MIDDGESTDSLIRIKKAKICSSLLHRIRVIQGHTNLNFNEPHFAESKDNVRQTKDIINSIKEGLKKGCSDLMKVREEQNNRFSSDTVSSLPENKKPRKRQTQKNNTEKEGKPKKCAVQEMVNFYEGGQCLLEDSGVKLSQIFDKNEENREKELQQVSSVPIDSKGNKKKRKIKRKREENDSNSSFTATASDMMKASHGDATIAKPKHRRNKGKIAGRRKPECSGDESDIEDDISHKLNDQAESAPRNVNKVRRKLRSKRSQNRNPSLASMQKNQKPKTPNITDIVTSTIARLNTVNESVKKVIEDSLSSPSETTSFASLSTITTLTPLKIPRQPHNSPTDPQLSTSSLNWSTVTNDVSDATVIQKPSTTEKSPVTETKKIPPKKIAKVKPQLVKEEMSPPQSTVVIEQVSPRLEEIISTKPKIKKNAEEKENPINKEVKEVKEVPTPRKKKNVKPKEPQQIEPVSSMKKSSKKAGNKKKEHVNFAATPEVVPDYVPPQATTPAVKTPVISVRETIKGPATPEKPPSPTKSIREEVANNISKKPKAEFTRRVSSAKMCRNVHKRVIPKIKSTSSIALDKNPPAAISVRTVLKEEEKKSEERARHRSRSRSHSRPRTKSGGKRDEDGKTKDVMEIYQKIRSNTTSTIAMANNQISSTLQAGMAHLNDICGKVRTTLSDIEKDEQTYKKLKSKKSFELSSEGGSVHDGCIISEQSTTANQGHKPQTPVQKPPSPIQTYTVITESRTDTTIGQLMNTISMAGDNLMMEPFRPPSSQEKKKRATSSKSKKRRAAPKSPKVPACPSKTKVAPTETSCSTIKPNSAKIPIWQRTPPSVIEEIQLTVKKQATKSQYREFLRALKSIARKQRSQVHVMPNDYRDMMEKQQDKAFCDTSRQKPSYILAGKRRKDVKLVDEPQAKNICKHCSSEKCTCGVVVQNTPGSLSQQRMHWMHMRTDPKRGIQAYDILDEITLKDLEPIQSEYPRKDHISDTDANKRIEETLLYKLLYHEDPKVLEALLRSSPPVTEQKKASHISKSQSVEKQTSASNAYKLYEQLEFNVEKDKPQGPNLSTTTATMCINPVAVQKQSREKPRPIQTCPKEFNDEVNIPADLKPILKTKNVKKKVYHLKLKSDEEKPTLRTRKKIEDKLKIIGKTSSMRSITKRIKAGKISKENIKVKLKNYSGDSKLRLKKILTVMPVSIFEKSYRKMKRRMPKIQILTKVEKEEQNSSKKINFQISEANLEKIRSMSKREIVHILKPYIFHDLQPPVIIAMPVSPKYNQQNKTQKQDHHINKTPTYKRVSNFLKDHDDDCRSGKKLCRRCQMSMQCGDETKRSDSVTSRRSEPLSQRQLWKNKYRPTAAEKLVTRVLGKNHQRTKFEVVPPDEKPLKKDMVINMTPMELNENATTTRNKLKEVKTIMESHKTLLGQDLDDIIDTLEFKIVDALSNPKNQHTDSFNEIEYEIKNILQTISELKEINKENIRQNTTKMKSKTAVSLDGTSDQTVSSSNRSNTDTDLIANNKNISTTDESFEENIEKNPPIEIVSPEIKLRGAETIEEKKEKELDDTYCSLGQDIQKVIEGLDAIMTLDDEDEVGRDVAAQTEEKVEKNEDNPKEDVDNSTPSESEDAIITFCQQVDEVIKTIGNMDELNCSTDTLDADVEVKRSDEYLTPFMRAVKDYRQNDTSTHTFVEFLDRLTMLSRDSVTLHIYPKVPMHRANLQHNAQIVEVARTYNQSIQYDADGLESTVDPEVISRNAIGDGMIVVEVIGDSEIMANKTIGDSEMSNKSASPEEKFYEAEDCAEEYRIPTPIKSKDVLSTNRWMQTDSPQEVQLEESSNKLIQTVSTIEEFNEIEDYMSSLDYVINAKPTPLIAEKKTQFPSDIDQSRFIKETSTSTKDCQVTTDLIETISVGVESQPDYTTVEVISADCRVYPSEANLDPIRIMSDSKSNIEMERLESSMEKYITSRLESCLRADLSDLSFDEYPRNIYTESHITRDKYEGISDTFLCGKRNSYPVTKIPENPSNIISLYENRKSHSRDFLEEGFGNNDSYDSMLVRYTSSENISSNTSSAIVDKPESTEPESVQTEEVDAMAALVEKKLIMEETKSDKRHKHLLHSVYGLVFTLMFLGINLNYSCCN